MVRLCTTYRICKLVNLQQKKGKKIETIKNFLLDYIFKKLFTFPPLVGVMAAEGAVLLSVLSVASSAFAVELKSASGGCFRACMQTFKL